MENPYESPTVQPQIRESMRSWWKRRLVCPHCHEARITVGWIAFYPGSVFCCPNCRQRFKIKLASGAEWKLGIAGLIPIYFGLSAIACLAWADPFDRMERVVVNWFPGFWTSLGITSTVSILASFLLFLALTLILLTAFFFVRLALRMIAYQSTLLPLPDRMSNETSSLKELLPPE